MNSVDFQSKEMENRGASAETGFVAIVSANKLSMCSLYDCPILPISRGWPKISIDLILK